MNKIELNGVAYIAERPEELDGMEYCVVLTYSAGVLSGYVKSRDGKEVVLRKARRIWECAAAHPVKTYLSDLLEKYPNTPLRHDGTPQYICPMAIGLNCFCDSDESDKCLECWNQPIEEKH